MSATQSNQRVDRKSPQDPCVLEACIQLRSWLTNDPKTQNSKSHGNLTPAKANGEAIASAVMGLISPKSSMPPTELPVKKWLLDTPVSHPTVSLPQGSSDDMAMHRCAVDPMTGELMLPIEYPDTHYDRKDDGGPKEPWRHAGMSSELHVVREVKARQDLASWIRSQAEAESKKALTEENSWPRVECTLRPATKSDLGQIAEILNLERQADDCSQFFSAQSYTISDVEQMYDTCKANCRPFIIATLRKHELFDRSIWPPGSDRAYQEWCQWKLSQESSSPDMILGFAFVTDARAASPDGRPCHELRFTGQIRITVHPNHRRQHYGTALFDRVLLSVAPYHKSIIDYEWECTETELVYEKFHASNKRQYAWVYAEVVHDGDFEWKNELLKKKFGFKKIAEYPQIAKANTPCEKKWLDLSVWVFNAQKLANVIMES